MCAGSKRSGSAKLRASSAAGRIRQITSVPAGTSTPATTVSFSASQPISGATGFRRIAS